MLPISGRTAAEEVTASSALTTVVLFSIFKAPVRAWGLGFLVIRSEYKLEPGS